MFFGPLRPLPADFWPGDLVSDLRKVQGLGVWAAGRARGVVCRTRGPAPAILVDPDLGFLLNRCRRIALRAGGRPVALDVATIIQWRTLQVATATPWLPGYERLAALFPGLERWAGGIMIPLQDRSPEDILAQCLKSGLQVTASTVVYLGDDGPSVPSFSSVPSCLSFSG